VNELQIKNIIEALLMASERPLALEDLLKVLSTEEKQYEKSAIKQILDTLSVEYQGRGLELKETASGYRFQVAAEFSYWVDKLRAGKELRYSRTLLETLALIAYRQPITRAEIEDIRGVAVSSNIMRTLIDHEWVRVLGYKEVPGKPGIYGTTKKFLDYFNLKNLEELPILVES
jgi:segregation and condensation protein B